MFFLTTAISLREQRFLSGRSLAAPPQGAAPGLNKLIAKPVIPGLPAIGVRRYHYPAIDQVRLVPLPASLAERS